MSRQADNITVWSEAPQGESCRSVKVRLQETSGISVRTRFDDPIAYAIGSFFIHLRLEALTQALQTGGEFRIGPR